MIRALRILGGTILGLLLSFVLIIGVELFSDVVHPYPKDFGGTHEEVCRHVERYPSWVLAAAVPMWAVAALAGTGVAQKIGWRYAAGIVGLLLVSALGLNLSMLPYPAWFKAANLIVIPATILACLRWSGRRPIAAPAEVNGPVSADAP